MTLRLLPVLALFAACTPVDDEVQMPHVPRFADVNFSADGYISLIDRNAALADAVEESEGGEPIDLSLVSDFFMVDIDSEDMQRLDDAIDRTEPDHSNVVDGMAALLSVDLSYSDSLGPMGATMTSISNVTLKEWTEWFWSGSQSVTNDEGVTVSAQFNVHWVNSGWLVEILQSTEDGAYNDTTWFSGYYAADGSLGWWDFYRSGGVLAVTEYMGDVGDGYAETYWATTDRAGDLMIHEWTAPGVGTVDFQDEQPPPNPADATTVIIGDDGAGMATIPDDFEDSVTVCWDADLLNIDCE